MPVQVTSLGTSVVEVAARALETCAIKQDGTLWCWGDNNWGQLGDGTASGQDCSGDSCELLPVQVTSLGTSVVEVAVGDDHTCARKQDGTLWCWGENYYGECGDGTTAGQDCNGFKCRHSPVRVTSLGTSVVEVAAGYEHTCARKQDGTLWCWGANGSGQLGDGTKVAKPSPAQVTSAGTSVVEVEAGNEHTCARKQDGTLWCWGYNRYGQLGDGTASNLPSPSPVQVVSCPASTDAGQDANTADATDDDVTSVCVSQFVEVAAGEYHTCAIKQDGTLWCWGNNNYSQLGDGTTTQRLSPVYVTSLGASVVEVAAGGSHTCARKQDDTLWCWGQNDDGQLGDGTMKLAHSPIQVTSLGTTVAEVAAGYMHTCARKQDGTLWCWGNND